MEKRQRRIPPSIVIAIAIFITGVRSMAKTTISDYSEAEFLAFVRTICKAEGPADKDDQLVAEFRRLTEHPDGSDLIYYPRDDREDSPEGIVQEVKEWRTAHGKPGFKPT